MEKLVTIQAELKAPKNKYNLFGKYNYRNAEGIQEAAKPLLLKHKCLLVLTDTIKQIGERYYVCSEAIFTDTETKETTIVSAFAREDEEIKGMHKSQITGATSSYARKYALNGLFLIDDSENADDNNNSKPATLESLSQEIAQCGSLEELETIYKQNVEFQNNNQFIKLLKEKKEFLA